MCEGDEGDFLLLLQRRRPDLRDLLLGPALARCRDQAVRGLLAGRLVTVGETTVPSTYQQPSLGPSREHRKLSLKLHIEGAPWVRPEGWPQLPKPALSSSEAVTPVPLKASPSLTNEAQASCEELPSAEQVNDSEDGTGDEAPILHVQSEPNCIPDMPILQETGSAASFPAVLSCCGSCGGMITLRTQTGSDSICSAAGSGTDPGAVPASPQISASGEVADPYLEANACSNPEQSDVEHLPDGASSVGSLSLTGQEKPNEEGSGSPSLSSTWVGLRRRFASQLALLPLLPRTVDVQVESQPPSAYVMRRRRWRSGRQTRRRARGGGGGSGSGGEEFAWMGATAKEVHRVAEETRLAILQAAADAQEAQRHLHTDLQAYLPTTRAVHLSMRLRRLCNRLHRFSQSPERSQEPSPTLPPRGLEHSWATLMRMASSSSPGRILRHNSCSSSQLVAMFSGGPCAVELMDADSPVRPAERTELPRHAYRGTPFKASIRDGPVDPGRVPVGGGSAAEAQAAGGPEGLVSRKESGSMDVTAVETIGPYAGRQTLQLPIQQPEPPILPYGYGNLARLSATFGSHNGLPKNPQALAATAAAIAASRHYQPHHVAHVPVAVPRGPTNNGAPAVTRSGPGGGEDSGGRGPAHAGFQRNEATSVISATNLGEDYEEPNEEDASPEEGFRTGRRAPSLPAAGPTQPAMLPHSNITSKYPQRGNRIRLRRLTQMYDNISVQRLEPQTSRSHLGFVPGESGAGGGTENGAGGSGSQSLSPCLADVLLATGMDIDAGLSARLGVIGNCRPPAAATSPPSLPSLKQQQQRGLRAVNSGTGRQKSGHNALLADGLVVRQHCMIRKTSVVAALDGGQATVRVTHGGGGGGANPVAMLLVAGDGGMGRVSPDMRQRKAYKLNSSTSLPVPTRPGAPTAMGSALPAAGRRSGVEGDYGHGGSGRSVASLPAINMTGPPRLPFLRGGAALPSPLGHQQAREE